MAAKLWSLNFGAQWNSSNKMVKAFKFGLLLGLTNGKRKLILDLFYNNGMAVASIVMWRHVFILTLTFHDSKVNTSLRADNDMKLALRTWAHIVHVTSMRSWLWLVYGFACSTLWSLFLFFNSTLWSLKLRFMGIYVLSAFGTSTESKRTSHPIPLIIFLYLIYMHWVISWFSCNCMDFIILYVRSIYSLYWSLSIHKKDTCLLIETSTLNKTQNPN